MIKNRIIVAIAAVLVIVLGIQFYIMFRLNDRLKQLSGQENQADKPSNPNTETTQFNFFQAGSG